ncbi:MAG: hypothetical protein LQ337_004307 [Flavoplaca oasis]|nr:MAG: hypothetical protein LQ337_004307 [Flavoplaca oasis]
MVPTSSTESNLQATITSAPVSQCPPCQVYPSAAGSFLSRVYWYNSTISLTLDTLSVVVTQYNKTALTQTSTIYGNFSTISPYDVPEAQDLQYDLQVQQYPGQPYIIFFNGTNDDVVINPSIHSPIPYVGIAGYLSFSDAKSDSGCPAGQVFRSSSCGCVMTSAFATDFGREFASFTAIDLAQTYYSIIPPSLKNNLQDDLFYDRRSLDVAAFSSFVLSVDPGRPEVKSCYFVDEFVGPPAVKVPVSALTATVTTTVSGTDRYDWTTATPALTASKEIPSETGNKDQPNQTPQSVQDMESLSHTIAYTLGPLSDSAVGSRVLTEGDENSVTKETPISIALGDDIALTETSNQDSQEHNRIIMTVLSIDESSYMMDMSSNLIVKGQTIKPAGIFTPSGSVISVPIIADTQSTAVSINPTPVVSFLGTTYTMDKSSKIVVEGQTVEPGGAVTLSGSIISVPTIKPLPTQTLIPTSVVSFLGSTLTMDMSSNFIFDGQTVKPGSAITVSGSILSVPHLVGPLGESSSQQSTVTIPLLSFGSSTYTMDMSSNFILGGQTIAPGSAITISGTAISRPTGDSLVVVGGVTETLSELVTTRDMEASPTVEATDIGSGASVRAGNPEEPDSVTPTASAGVDGSINPSDFESTASASALRSLSVVISGLCIGLGFTTSLL